MTFGHRADAVLFLKTRTETGTKLTESPHSPAELRRMFGANLRQLARRYPSVSELCRQLGINRTQFNRYLAGESFPRPDVLDRICRFFDVDARILLKPLDEIETHDHPASEIIDRFLSTGAETVLAPGFYHAAEAAHGPESQTRHRLFFVRRIGHCTMLRGYEPRSLMPGEPAQEREIRGIVSYTGGPLCALVSRRGAKDCRMMVLSEQLDEDQSRWSGYVYRLSASTKSGSKVHKLELRHIGHDLPTVLRLSRRANTRYEDQRMGVL